MIKSCLFSSFVLWNSADEVPGKMSWKFGEQMKTCIFVVSVYNISMNVKYYENIMGCLCMTG